MNAKQGVISIRGPQSLRTTINPHRMNGIMLPMVIDYPQENQATGELDES